MAGLKVKINAPRPTAEIINRYRDFDRFMNQYRKYYSTAGIRNMLYKDRKKLVYIVIIILFLLLLLFAEDINPPKNDSPDQQPIIEKVD